MNAGKIPSSFTSSGFSGAKLKKDVGISTPAGTFIADEIYGANKTENLSYSVFIDTTSGIIAGYHLKINIPCTPGSGTTSIYTNLTHTDIPMGSGGNAYIWIIVAGVILASVIAVVWIVFIRKRKK